MEFDNFMKDWEMIRSSYALQHPILSRGRETYYWFYRLWHNKIFMIPKEIKWFYQRGRRGFSDQDVWSFDYYLADVISKGCRQLAVKSCGYPSELTEEEWRAILITISKGFQNYKDNFEFVGVEDKEKMDVLFLLFRMYFLHLWD